VVVMLAALIAATVGCPDTQIDARTDPRSTAARAGHSDERELAHRLGAPDTSRLPVGRPPTPEGPALSDAEPEPTELGVGLGVGPAVIEGIAWGDLARFEDRLREELAEEGLVLAAAIDLHGDPRTRLFVVTPTPPAGGPPLSVEALARARIVLAYAERDEPERIHIAYPVPPERGHDARVDAAIHRAADR
jgi:hypothetical protein